jgi:hypothetical protein
MGSAHLDDPTYLSKAYDSLFLGGKTTFCLPDAVCEEIGLAHAVICML